LEKELKAAAKPPINENELHSEYSKHLETNGFTLQAGSGLSVRLNSALSYLADVKYSYSWTNGMTGLKNRSGLQFTTGLVLRMGTW